MPVSTLPPFWKFACDGVTLDAASAGITDLTRHRASQAADRCTVRAAGRPCDAAPLFPFGRTVTVRRGGAAWFAGRVTAVPGGGDGHGEEQVYELCGPWWYLENLVCRQEWKLRGGAETGLLGRLVLGQALDGSRLTTGQVIAETLAYAIDSGAPLAAGVIDPDLYPPLDEVKDVTCAEVIRKMLRWHPDRVAWFDYSTEPHPTFHCRARGSLPAATLTVGRPPLAAVRGVTARPDLQVPAVVVHYESTGRADGAPYTDVATDAAPAGATGREFGAVVLTVPLRGGHAAGVAQRVVTRPVVDTPGADGLLAFLTSRCAALALLEGVTITAISRGLADPDAVEPSPSDPGVNQPAVYDPTLTRELVEGHVTDWMRAGDGIRAQQQRIVFAFTAAGGGAYQGAFDFIATNARTGTYRTLTSCRAGDAAPAGLAAAFLAALSPLQYGGSVTLVEAEPGGAVPGAGLGSVLNLAGSARADWAAMRALVVEEETRVAAGETVLMFGPPGHLRPADLAASLQTTRPGVGGRAGGGPGATATGASAERVGGAPDPAAGVGLGVTSPVQNACVLKG